MAESKNMDEAGEFFEPLSVQICKWYPQREGEGKPEQVHIVLSMATDLHLMIRLKSRAGALAFIADLQKHTDAVWPPQ